MKYYLIVGEASGDLHASRLMRSLKQEDPSAEFRFFGGDLMTAEGGTRVRHFKEIAYMGFVPVVMHLKTILQARKQCKEDIRRWQPDVVILVDYAGFNLNIAKSLTPNPSPIGKGSCKLQTILHNKFLKKTYLPSEAPLPYRGGGGGEAPIFYYISPKIWAWKEGRIKQFKRYVDQMFCILPFEVDFFERKHNYPVHYVGNPTAGEVKEFIENYSETEEQFRRKHNLDSRPIIALLAGSRRQEIKDNLPMMRAVASHFPQYQFVLACAPAIDNDYYDRFLQGTDIRRVNNSTYPLLHHATSALVTSGTATLETCCFNTPQVVLYKTPLPRIARFVWDNFFKVKYISLVNLIADREVVPEMMADKFTETAIRTELEMILPGRPERDIMLAGYQEVHEKLGSEVASDNAARIMVSLLRK